MRLFLSSQDFGNYPEVLVKLMGQNKKAAFIANAMDDQPEYRDSTLSNKLKEFRSIGLDAENLDLRDYFGKKNSLEKKLENYGLVWARGGNTFILRRAMAFSGFDEIIKDKLKKDELVYGGSSAGSCVAAKSLKGIDKGDRPNPDVVPESYPDKQTIWNGLGLVNFMLVPHCGSEWFASEADESIKYLKAHHFPYKALKDGQVIVVHGDKEELLG